MASFLIRKTKYFQQAKIKQKAKFNFEDMRQVARQQTKRK